LPDRGESEFCLGSRPGPDRRWAIRPFLDGGTLSTWGCYEFRYQISDAEVNQAQSITLAIDGGLRMSPPPGDPDTVCLAARLILIAQYPGLDFQCHFSGAGYHTSLKLPAGLTTEQARQIITDAIKGAIYGPWLLAIR
jgi:hypothetical protein